MRTSTIGRSPEMPWAQRLGCPLRLRAMRLGGARKDGFANSTWLASRS